MAVGEYRYINVFLVSKVILSLKILCHVGIRKRFENKDFEERLRRPKGGQCLRI